MANFNEEPEFAGDVIDNLDLVFCQLMYLKKQELTKWQKTTICELLGGLVDKFGYSSLESKRVKK